MTEIVIKTWTHFSREQLYHLVWSEPARELATQLGVSEATLVKHCRNHQVPIPGRAYWTKRAAGESPPQPKLTPGDLFTENVVRFYSAPSPVFAARVKALAEAYPAPTVEELRQRLATRLGQLTTPKTLKEPHRAVRVLVERDAALLRSPGGWARGVYQSPYQQLRLRILNGIFLGVSRAGGIPRLSGYEASNIRFEMGGHYLDATLEVPRGGSAGSFKPTWTTEAEPKRLVFTLDTRNLQIEGKTRWRDENDVPLEDQVTEIVLGIGEVAERLHREELRRAEQWRREHEAWKAAEERKRREEAERQRRERLAAEAQARLDALLGDADSLGRAERLRAYVEQVLERPPSDVSPQSLHVWAAYVRAEADLLDPQTSGRLTASIEEALQAGMITET